MKLELNSLKNAVSSLDKAINSYNSLCQNKNLTKNDIDTLKSGVIQNFEVAYEQCWKFIQRWIKENRSSIEADQSTRKDLFRKAASYGLIENPVSWFDYGDKRNLTSHTYDGNTAQCVFKTAIKFLADAKYLEKRLEESND